MLALVQEKERAIELRKKGYSYKEILKNLNVAKSTLSFWLKDLPLTPHEKEHLKQRRDGNMSRGRIRAGAALRARRLDRDRMLLATTRQEFETHKHEALFQIGIALYWAEGTKRSSVFAFTNSDEDMIETMLLWIERYWGVMRNNIGVRLYIHKPYANEGCEYYWSKRLQVPLPCFKKTVYKPTGSLVKKRPGYRGCIRIELGKTTNLRKMQFLQRMQLEIVRDSS